jgi:pimeloyl-ACP methyl ester carboxylesterase
MELRKLDVVDQLAHIGCLTLVCVGELDPGTPVDASWEIVDVLPRGVGRHEVIEGAGHLPWKDVPDRYWAVMEDFVVLVGDRAQIRPFGH